MSFVRQTLMSLLILAVAEAVTLSQYKLSDGYLSESSVDEISQRLADLEAKTIQQQNEIAALKKKSDEDGLKMGEEITELKSEIRRQESVNKALVQSVKLFENCSTSDKADRDSTRPDQINKTTVRGVRAGNEKRCGIDLSKRVVTRSVNEHNVAFFASVTPHDVPHLGVNRPIVFDNAIVNIGNAYLPLTGIFTAPVNGTYVFSATVYGRNPNGYMYFALEKNNAIYARFEIKINQQVSQTVILDVRQGDEVCVKTLSNDHDLIGQKFTTFSGFLLYENYDVPSQIVG